MERYSRARALTAALCVFLGTAGVSRAELSLLTGVDYSSGDYGASEETRILYVPLTLKLERERYIFRLTVPYLRIDAPVGGEVIAVGPDGQPIRAATGRRETNTGPGDVVAAGTYNVAITEAGAFFDVTGKIKLATADETKGLGTGENDYSLQLDWAQAFERLTPFATGGYRVYGDPPGIDFDNVFFGSLGGSYAFTADTSGGVVYDFRESLTPGSDPVRELTAFVTRATGDRTKLQAYVLTGFSDSSPDWGAGTVVIIPF